MAYFEVKDEILNGAPKFRIRDKDGNILIDNVSIEMITEILQQGTELNKALFDIINESIESVGTYMESQVINMNFTPVTEISTWASSIKSDVKTFNLSTKRFFFIITQKISTSITVSTEIKNIFLLDTKLRVIFPLNNDAEVQINGTDFNSTSPKVHKLEDYSSGSGYRGLTIAFLNLNDNNLEVQLGWINSTIGRPSTGVISWRVDVCETLANKEE